MGARRADRTGRGLRAPLRRALGAVLGCALAGAAALGGAGTAAAAPVPATHPDVQERQVVDGINAERAARGLPPLAELADVSAVAQRWADAEAATGQYRHNPAAGAELAGYSATGEVIHLSLRLDTDGAWAVRGWMDSPPHRAILLGDFTGVGVGVAVGPPRRPGAQAEVHYVVDAVRGTRPSTVLASSPVVATFANGAAVHRLQGAILARYRALGGPGGLLGAPTTSELPTPDRAGRFTHFERGSLYWAPATGAQVVRGAIRGEWAGLGWERSALGYPTGEEFAVRDGGRAQRFAGGLAYWTSALGAHAVHGAIGAHYAAQRWESGPLGYPRTGEYAVPGGVRQDFQGGSLTYRWAERRVTRS
ncbi:CAP domain-containing protein [Kineococcus gypseus]|uniref:CAP domain-containing protein n=1 Tax=Kineococcus gypseus TaxID=1637102 RepID=UPI003D7C41DE